MDVYPTKAPFVFTIGHSNQPVESFLTLLKYHKIEVLVDVRSHPHSKHAAQFDAKNIRLRLNSAGIKYLYLGKVLGGRPKDNKFYDEHGRVLYHRLAELPVLQAGISRLEKGLKRFRVAVMCSEENPNKCHRRLLVGQKLSEKGINVYHIRSDGKIQSEADIREAEKKRDIKNEQLSLLPE